MKTLFIANINQEALSLRSSVALGLLRAVVGVAFVLHGAGKIMTPFSWMGPDAPVPALLQGLAALAEFGGGIALILGLLTPLASVGILATMAVAIQFHMGKGDGFMGGYELALVYFTIAGLLLLLGPGRFSLDHVIVSKRK